jgi:hypothetical protein
MARRRLAVVRCLQGRKMNYDFYASKADKLQLLEYLFKETDLRVFDLSSAPDEKVREYKSTEEIEHRFDLENGQQFAGTFQLWSPNFLGQIQFEKVVLNPMYCKGHTFRYTTSGWGLIQLYFGGLDKHGLHASHIGHNSEKRALGWESLTPALGPVQQWDWKAVNATSRKLRYLLHQKWAVNKKGSRGILAGAEKMRHQGIILTN